MRKTGAEAGLHAANPPPGVPLSRDIVGLWDLWLTTSQAHRDSEVQLVSRLS